MPFYRQGSGTQTTFYMYPSDFQTTTAATPITTWELNQLTGRVQRLIQSNEAKGDSTMFPMFKYNVHFRGLKQQEAHYRVTSKLEREDTRINRDRFRSRVDIIMKRHSRKTSGKRVAGVVKQYKAKSAELYSALFNVGLNATDFQSTVRKLFGFNVLSKLEENRKRTWVAPVWQHEPWFARSKYWKFHDVHQSEDDPYQIAYNRTADNIERNIQTRTRPGKYLAHFFGDVLTPVQIKEWAEKQVAHATCTAELRFVENDNPDGWVHVYRNGPHSCMKGTDSVKVYCYPGNGLRLAYLEDNSGNIVARAIVRDGDEDVKGYVRLYSTEQRWTTALYAMLSAVGYENETNLDGVKIQRIEGDWNEVMCPYIDQGNDGEQGFADKGDHLLLGHSDFEACNTGGWVKLIDGVECGDCGETRDEDDMTWVEGEERQVCSCCIDNYRYAYGRRDYCDYYPEDDVIYCESDNNWYVSEYASNHDVYECQVTSDWYHIDDLIHCDAGQYEGQYIHVDEAEMDHHSEQWMGREDMTEINGKWVDDEYVGTCHITGETIDTREAVEVFLNRVVRYSAWVDGELHRVCGNKYIYVSAGAWNVTTIRENFIRSGGMLLTREFYGNEINDVAEPDNLSYGEHFEGEHFEDLFVEEAEELLAA